MRAREASHQSKWSEKSFDDIVTVGRNGQPHWEAWRIKLARPGCTGIDRVQSNFKAMNAKAVVPTAV